MGVERQPWAASHRAPLFLWALTLLCLTGCPSKPHPPPDPPPATRSTAEIISTLNTNSSRINQALWSSSVSVTARLTDHEGAEHRYNLDGTFLFRRPGSLRMDLRPSLGENVMQIGSNRDEYWVWIEPELGMMRWGRHENVGKPCSENIAIHPHQLAAAVGLGELPEAGDGLLGPARVWGSRYDRLVYLRSRGDGSYLLDREYRVERVPPYMIRLVVFRDALGRRSMSAFLDDYRPAWKDGPLVPHAVNIDWPLDGGNFTMRMDRVRGVRKVSPTAFERPQPEDLPAGVTDVVQVDADCP